MSIFQFLRIFWARKWLIAATTVSSLLGAIIVIIMIPPRWEAHSRVMLNLLKPDPVTGEIVGGNSAGIYVASQTELITDYTVAGQVVDQLGWLSDPRLIRSYERRSANDKRDFRRWLAQMVIDGTSAQVLDGSNILEITYRSDNPDTAKLVADAVRRAYLDTSLVLRRDEANRNADWFQAQSDAARIQLNAAEGAKADYERQNGIVMADDDTDIDTARLRALAGAGAVPPIITSPAVGLTPAELQLTQLDAQIAEAAKTLGPNHPEMQALRATRAALARQEMQERGAAQSQIQAAASAAAANASAINAAVSSAKSRVVAETDKLARLAQLQDEVNMRRDQFTKSSQRAADFREQAAIADTGLMPLADAVTPKSASFPNKPLILMGSLGLGLSTGLLAALLIELFYRRVRGVEDLGVTVGAPVLAVIAAPPRIRGGAALG